MKSSNQSTMLVLKHPVLSPDGIRVYEIVDKKPCPIYVGHHLRNALMYKSAKTPPSQEEEADRFNLILKITKALGSKIGDAVKTPFSKTEVELLDKAMREWSQATTFDMEKGEKLFFIRSFDAQQVLAFLRGAAMQPEPTK